MLSFSIQVPSLNFLRETASSSESILSSVAFRITIITVKMYMVIRVLSLNSLSNGKFLDRTVNNCEVLRFYLLASLQVSLPQFHGCWKKRGDFWIRNKVSITLSTSNSMNFMSISVLFVLQVPWGDSEWPRQMLHT